MESNSGIQCKNVDELVCEDLSEEDCVEAGIYGLNLNNFVVQNYASNAINENSTSRLIDSSCITD